MCVCVIPTYLLNTLMHAHVLVVFSVFLQVNYRIRMNISSPLNLV